VGRTYINVADIGADALSDIPMSTPAQNATTSVPVSQSQSPGKGLLLG